jgi:hypothetical protein
MLHTGRNPINGNERELIEDARRNLYFLKKTPSGVTESVEVRCIAVSPLSAVSDITITKRAAEIG